VFPFQPPPAFPPSVDAWGLTPCTFRANLPERQPAPSDGGQGAQPRMGNERMGSETLSRIGYPTLVLAEPQRLERVLKQAVEERTTPGAVAAVGVGPHMLWSHAVGWADLSPPSPRPMTWDTIFDLASLTKVVATLPSILLLVEEGTLTLEDPVHAYLPEFADEESVRASGEWGSLRRQVTLWHLLTHTSGLPAHREYHRHLRGEEVVQAAAHEPLRSPPGRQVVYSDLGFILLGRVVEKVTGLTLDVFSRERVFEPLGMRDTGFLPGPELSGRIAATEVGPDGPKVGVVHDENAQAMGGVAGHAGLFSTAADLARYAQSWLGPESLWTNWTRRRAIQDQVAALGGHRGLGWVLRHDAYDHTGDLWPEGTFGHTGFTGTSMAMDPDSGVWAILLTNRVHFGRDVQVGPLRRAFHNAVAGALR
jgi:CubicO group peptidase (beta-lactamase class C family)